MGYELIGLDMDGTLLNSEKKINSGVILAIKEAIENGKHISLSSGRALAEIEEYREQLKDMEYAILESGALVYNLKNEEIISASTIDEEIVSKIFDTVKDKDVFIHLISKGRSISPKRLIPQMEKYHMGIYIPLYERVCTKVEDTVTFHNEDKQGIEKINLFHTCPQDREDTRKKLQGLPIVMLNAEDTSLEISPLGVTKGYGLKKLCKHLNIEVEQSIVVGDADNDLDVLKTAGLAVAMGNANANVKKIADVEVMYNAHDGVAEAIYKYLLEK